MNFLQWLVFLSRTLSLNPQLTVARSRHGSIFSLASSPIPPRHLTLSGISVPPWPHVLPLSLRNPSGVWFPYVNVSPRHWPECARVILCVMASLMHNPHLLIPHPCTRGSSVSLSLRSQSSYQTQVSAEETKGFTCGMRKAG